MWRIPTEQDLFRRINLIKYRIPTLAERAAAPNMPIYGRTEPPGIMIILFKH